MAKQRTGIELEFKNAVVNARVKPGSVGSLKELFKDRLSDATMQEIIEEVNTEPLK